MTDEPEILARIERRMRKPADVSVPVEPIAIADLLRRIDGAIERRRTA